MNNNLVCWFTSPKEGDHPFSEWSSPSQIPPPPPKTQFPPFLKIQFMHSQKVFFVVIKLTAGIQFLCLFKICWEWELTILVKSKILHMEENELPDFFLDHVFW